MTNDFTSIFIDKMPIILPKLHRFYELSVKLQTHQGVDILPYTDNNELLVGLVRENAIKHHQKLLNSNPPPQACVLVVLTDEMNPRLLLTRRSSQLNSHAGEVSLVGGKRDDVDKSSVDVALREAYEEVGLHGADVQILGYLPMQISKQGLLVRPVVASIDVDVIDGLIPSENEIAKLFWLPFEVLQSPLTNHVFDRQLHDKATKLHTPAWIYGDEVIWGLTGRILANLMEIGFGIKHEWYYKVR